MKILCECRLIFRENNFMNGQSLLKVGTDLCVPYLFQKRYDIAHINLGSAPTEGKIED
jgi:hypothetical protein